jgi:hypothetical protein
MSLQEELEAVQHRLNDLLRCVSRLEQQVGGSLDMRRVRADAARLGESMALLRESAPKEAARERPEMVTIPDAPYDPKLWAGERDDEGLGSPYRHAP